MESKVGDLTVRQLSDILGRSPGSQAKLKEAAAEKFPGKEIKDAKDNKEHKEQKDHKEPKDHKDQKDLKDHKEPKDQKDQKDHKEPKDQKDNADHKAQKDHKDGKDHKDHKDIKDGLKDTIKDRNKEALKELEQVPQKRDKDLKDSAEQKNLPETPGKGPVEGGPEGGAVSQPGVEDLVRRVTGLEQEVAQLRQAGQGTSG
jgi:hypothetical protein